MASREELIAAAKKKFDREQLVNAAKQKFTEENAAPTETPLSDKIETGARSAISGATLGLSEPVFSGINAAIDVGLDKAFDLEDENKSLTDRFKEAYSKDVERRRGLREQNEGIDIAGQVGGAVASIPVTLGAKTVAALPAAGKATASLLKSGSKVAEVGAEGARALVEAIPGAQRLLGAQNMFGRAARIAKGAAEGGGAVFTSEALRKGVGYGTGFIREEDKEPSLTEMVATGAKFGGALRSVPEVYSALKSGAKKGISVVLGPKTEAIDEFLTSAERLRGKQFKPELEKTKDAIQLSVDDLARKAGQESLNASDEIQVALNSLKQKVGDASRESREILDRSNAELSKQDVVGAFNQAIGKIRKVGGKAISESAKQAEAQLNGLKEELASLPVESFKGNDIKNILQSLDEQYEVVSNAGEFGSLPGSLIKDVRRTLDTAIKTQSKEYAEKMKDVAKLSQLLDESSRRFGTQEKALSAINVLGTGKTPIQDPMLSTLAQETGLDLQKVVQARDASQAFRNFQGAGTENAIKSFLNDRNIEIKRKFAQLSQVTDQDFVRMVDDLKTLRPFEGEFRMGSRNVNFWTALGAGSGAFLAGPTGAGVGGMLGGGLGATIDKFGPTMAKKILENYSKIPGVPTIRKIENAFNDLPPQVVEELKADYIRAVATMQEGAPVYVPEGSRDQLRRDIIDSELSNTQKAKLVNGLNTSGQIDGAQLSRVLVGNPQKKSDAQKFLEAQ